MGRARHIQDGSKGDKMREGQLWGKQETSKVATAMVTMMRVSGTISKNIQGGNSHGDKDHCNHAIASPPKQGHAGLSN